MVKVMSAVAFGIVTKEFDRLIEKLGITYNV